MTSVATAKSRDVLPAKPERPAISPARALLILWAGWSLGKIVAGGRAIAGGNLGDTDDYMRLAQWRDFLAGQNWVDLRQHRYIGPDGGDLHFTRLPDAAMSALDFIAQPFLGAAAAERLTLLLYPPLLLLAFLSACALAAARLAGRNAAYAAIALALLASPVMAQFAPGRIDHHGLALVFAMCSLAALLHSFERPRAAIAAAAATTLAAATSLETASVAAAAPIALGAVWIARGEFRALRLFGATLLLLAPLMLLTLGGADAFSKAHCDAYGAPAALALASAGAASVLLSFMKTRSVRARAVAALAVALAVGAALAAAYPRCLAGPFAGLDPLTREIWLASVSEFQAPAALIAASPGAFIGHYAFPLIALIAGVVYLRSLAPADRLRFGAALGLAFAGGLMMAPAVRGAAIATAFAIPPLAAVLAHAALHVRAGRPHAMVRFAALCAFVSPLSYAALGDFVDARRWVKAPTRSEAAASGCRDIATIAALRALPPSLLFNSIDLGPPILAVTAHSVTAAPYHRTGRSLRRTIDLFTADDSSAQAIFAESGADYLVLCPLSAETATYAARAPGGLAARLAGGETPDWLQSVDVAAAAPLAIYSRR